jgi:hypothetical protein
VDCYDSFIIFTDYFLRYGYIYPIKELLEVLDKFKIFKVKVENQCDLKINVVRSNRGRWGYYVRHTPYDQVAGPFTRFPHENGIVT